MISFPELGQWGRLGNQLFQMAATIALALDYQDEYGFPPWEHDGRFPISGCFGAVPSQGPEYREPKFSYSPIPYQENLRLYGFFQSWRHFNGRAPEIRKLLTPYGDRTVSRGVASIHVRRTDYTASPNYHYNLPVEYYELAAAYLKDHHKVRSFLVFSDDPDWCEATFTGEEFETVRLPDTVDALVAMAACEHHVIANSSFSWWAAYLGANPERVAIAPKRWFGPEGPDDEQDICPEGWVKL